MNNCKDACKLPVSYIKVKQMRKLSLILNFCLTDWWTQKSMIQCYSPHKRRTQYCWVHRKHGPINEELMRRLIPVYIYDKFVEDIFLWLILLLIQVESVSIITQWERLCTCDLQNFHSFAACMYIYMHSPSSRMIVAIAMKGVSSNNLWLCC